MNRQFPGDKLWFLILSITGSSPPASEMLKQAGADVNAQEGAGRTALIGAAGRGHVATVKALLEAGADVNAKDNKGKTAFMWAEKHGRTEIVQLLKQAGAKE